jgi:hypothetical protein
VRDPEGRLQPHAWPGPGQRPALAAAAIGLGLVDELRMLRDPVVVGGGTPFLPPDTVVRVISASPELSSSLDNLAASVER